MIRRYLSQLAGDLPGIVLAALLSLAVPFAVAAYLLETTPLP